MMNVHHDRSVCNSSFIIHHSSFIIFAPYTSDPDFFLMPDLTQRSDRRPLGDHRQEPGEAAARFRHRRRSASRAASARSARATKTRRPAKSSPTASPARSATGEGWRVRVVPNKFPALEIEGELNKRGEGIYDMMRGVGAPRGDHRIARSTW